MAKKTSKAPRNVKHAKQRARNRIARKIAYASRRRNG